MPGTSTLRQESKNGGKLGATRSYPFIFEGPDIGSAGKTLCISMQEQLLEGIEDTKPAEPHDGKPATLITRMARLVVEKARQSGQLCYVALDAYFSAGPVFEILKQAVDEKGKRLGHVITRAKDNYVAYRYPEAPQERIDEKKRVALRDFFDSPQLFTQAELNIYGKARLVRYYCEDLLWKPVNDLVRFVWVIDGSDRYILMCSDLDMPAPQIITIYPYRAGKNVKTNQGDSEMDQQMKMAKQLVDIQKASLGGMINSMIMFWDQTDRVLENILDQAPWVTPEGKKMVREWVAGNKKGCETFKDVVDEGFNKLESSFARGK